MKEEIKVLDLAILLAKLHAVYNPKGEHLTIIIPEGLIEAYGSL